MSTYEGLPMVLIEAASVGLPAIVTPVGGITEIVKDGVNGKVIPRSVDSLVESIEKLYDSPETLSQMGKAARAAHSQCFDVVKVVELYHSVYTNFEPNAATGTNKHR
jgi:glycosyltransferase involved in cell wall biosynthesis